MITLRETDDGIVLSLKVLAGSRAAGLRGIQDGALKVSVTVAPEKGKANKAVLKLLAKQLSLPKTKVQIISGHTNSQKQVLVIGVDLESLRAKIIGLVGKDDA